MLGLERRGKSQSEMLAEYKDLGSMTKEQDTGHEAGCLNLGL